MIASSINIRLIDPAHEFSEILGGLSGDLSAASLRDMITRTSSLSSPTIYVGAETADGMVGLVAFMAHQVEMQHEKSLAYQAAGVLTSSAHRGRGIFPSIVREAEPILRQRGGRFVFGFPNASAFPIWTKKLGYSSIPTLTWRAPTVGGLLSFFLRDDVKPTAGITVYQDDDDMIEMKRRLYGADVLVARQGASLVWGVRRTRRKYGMTGSLLDIGGLRFRDRKELRELIGEFVQLSSDAVAVRLSTVSNNPQNAFLKRARIPNGSQYCLIARDLSGGGIRNLNFCFYGGITDTY